MSRFLCLALLIGCGDRIDDKNPAWVDTGDSVPPDDTDDPVSFAPLEERITDDGMWGHLQALQAIADANGGTRAVGTDGYEQSVDYVVSVLEAAGYTPQKVPFTIDIFELLAPSALHVTEPVVADLSAFIATFEYSGSGDVTAPVVAVDLVIPAGSEPDTSTSGCEDADFVDFPSGAVALIQRGSCTFVQKVQRATAAGASAVILFNEGQEGRTAAMNSSLSADDPAIIPVLSADYVVGEGLSDMLDAGDTVTVSVLVDAQITPLELNNVIAERPGLTDQWVMVGGHLDSVEAGPGINDNGTGSALNLEIAERLAEDPTPLQRGVRLAWWGAEELGLLGSTAWVSARSSEEIAAIDAYLNYDMLGSPNGGRFVYDGDGSESEDGAYPAGSGTIEALYHDYFLAQGLADGTVVLNGRSDHAAFLQAEIPCGGLFSGAEQIMRPDETEDFGGVAGTAYDQCYHQACDDLENVNRPLYGEMSRSAAYALRVLAEGEVLDASR